MQHRTHSWLAMSVILLILLLASRGYGQQAKETPPNIILFLVDDMGPMDTTVPFLTDAKGNPETHPLNQFYKTPNMEELAKQGIRFTQFYAHSVCSPTRASLLTGQNSARHGTTNWIYSESNNRTEFGPMDWNWKGLTKKSVTLPRLFQKEGYRTIHVGKAHFGPMGSEGEDPLHLGFDVNVGGSSIGQPGSYYGQEGYGHLQGEKARAVPHLEHYHGQDVFLTEALTLEAKKAISKAKEEEKPFFLYMAHYAVHAPFQSDPRFVAHYAGSGKSEKAQAYASLIEGIDKSLGDLMDHVKKMGAGENTLLLFLGDNGSDAPLPIKFDYSSSEPLKGTKGNHWEGGMRVPFIASWVSPKDGDPLQRKIPIARNAIQTQMGTILDIFPTLCQAANLDFPKDHLTDGVALQKQLNGTENPDRKEVFLNHFPHGNHRSTYFTSLVREDWKVIYHYPVLDLPKYELFHLKRDPFETRDKANENPKQLRRMMQYMSEEMKNHKALYPQKDNKVLSLVIPKKGR